MNSFHVPQTTFDRDESCTNNVLTQTVFEGKSSTEKKLNDFLARSMHSLGNIRF